MWSIGCIFAELIGRRILFEAADPASQLEMITDLLGTPTGDDVVHIASPVAMRRLLSRQKPVSF